MQDDHCHKRMSIKHHIARLRSRHLHRVAKTDHPQLRKPPSDVASLLDVKGKCTTAIRESGSRETRHSRELVGSCARDRVSVSSPLPPTKQFRLCTEEACESMMKQFESGEMLRMPLDSVILMLKEILHEETTPALLNCLEPSDFTMIERSCESLFRSNFISEPTAAGAITVLGAFVSALGVDLALGALMGLGASQDQ